MANINTDNIMVFPLAKPRIGKKSSNLFYEKNISNIVNQISGVSGFVVTEDINDSFEIQGSELKLKPNKEFQFSILGRLFTLQSEEYDITLCQISGSSTNVHIYANIKIDDNGEISGQDNGTQYTGLNISTSIEPDCTALKILHIDSEGNISVPPESYVKTTLSSFAKTIQFIDGRR